MLVLSERFRRLRLLHHLGLLGDCVVLLFCESDVELAIVGVFQVAVHISLGEDNSLFSQLESFLGIVRLNGYVLRLISVFAIFATKLNIHF